MLKNVLLYHNLQHKAESDHTTYKKQPNFRHFGLKLGPTLKVETFVNNRKIREIVKVPVEVSTFKVKYMAKTLFVRYYSP